MIIGEDLKHIEGELSSVNVIRLCPLNQQFKEVFILVFLSVDL